MSRLEQPAVVKAEHEDSLRFRREIAGGLTRKASLNMLAAGIDFLARLAVGFFIQPFLVRGLGDYLYGTWQVLGRLMGYMSAATGRPGPALKWSIANQQGSSDFAAKRRQVGSAVVVCIVFMPVVTVAGALLAWVGPRVLQAPPEVAWSIRLAIVLLVADVSLLSMATVPESVLQGENLGYKRMGLSTLLVVVGSGLTVMAVLAGTGIVGLATVSIVMTLLTSALFLAVARSQTTWFGLARPSFVEIRSFLALSGWFLAWRVVSVLLTASDVVVLGLVRSPEVVTGYVLTKYAPETVVHIVGVITSGVAPGLGGIIGGRDLEKARRVREEMVTLAWLVATSAGTVVLLWNPSFLGLWVGRAYYPGSAAALVIMLMMTQLMVLGVDSYIIDLTLRLREKVLTSAFAAVLSIGAATLLAGPLDLGIAGLALGLVSGRMILTFVYPALVGRFLGRPLASQMSGITRPLLTTLILFGAAMAISETVTAGTWLTFLPAVAATVPIAFALAFYGGLRPGRRQDVRRRFEVMVRPLLARRGETV